jgi:hypothetical protein
MKSPVKTKKQTVVMRMKWMHARPRSSAELARRMKDMSKRSHEEKKNVIWLDGNTLTQNEVHGGV